MVGNYMLEGVAFELIPNDAVGIIGSSNGATREWLNTESPRQIYDITSRTKNSIIMTQRETSTHGTNSYLALIVSPDRSKIYWENETRPLP